jgi:hypothetical protein
MAIRTIKDINKGVDDAYKDIEKRLFDAVNVGSIALQRHIRQDVFVQGARGASAMRGYLASRSGELKKNINLKRAEVAGNNIRGGVGIGTVYGKMHFDGQTHTITPKGHPFLAIPLSAAQGNYGQAKGGPLDESLWGETFIGKSKGGNLIIFGKMKYVKGAHAGQTKGQIVPLFLLRRSVTVKAATSPKELFMFVKPIIDDKLKAGKN